MIENRGEGGRRENWRKQQTGNVPAHTGFPNILSFPLTAKEARADGRGKLARWQRGMPNTINSFFRAGFKRTGWLAAAAIDEEGENKNLHDCEELKQKTDFNMSRVKCFEREKNQTDLP